MFVNLVWPPKLAKVPPRYVFLLQIIDGNCIFSHALAKLANMVQDKKIDKHTFPQPWGASQVMFRVNVSATGSIVPGSSADLNAIGEIMVLGW